MTIGKISDEQAKQFAYAFISEIPRFIEKHKREYLAYLEATGQQDTAYQNKNAEAEQ